MRFRSSLWCAMLLIAGVPAAFAQSGVSNAQCQMEAKDAYGQPASNIRVTLVLLNRTGDPNLDFASAVYTNGWTDSTGRVSLSVSGNPHMFVECFTTTPGSGYVAYPGEQDLASGTENAVLSGKLILVPKPNETIPLAGGGSADLYKNGSYDKPVVVAEPFKSTQIARTAPELWVDYNGNPRQLAGGMLLRLFLKGYDVWLVRARHVGDDLNLQAADYARAISIASTYQGYNGKVTAAGYSMGGLVVRVAMARWSSYGVGSTLPVNLIAALDSPLRGALVNNDAQHAFWNASFDNGGTAHEHNMDSCAAQEMLENACHKTYLCDDCLECNDRGWYETFYGGTAFNFCNPSQGSCANVGLRFCSGLGLLNLPNGGWPAGIRKIGASLGKIGERTNVCYGDLSGLDKTGTETDGCPAVDSAVFGLGTEWGYVAIGLSSDRHFYYRFLNVSSDPSRSHWIDELSPGSRQPGSVEDVEKTYWIFKMSNGHQLLHMGTFIPLDSALDRDPGTGVSSLDEYWTNGYSAFHDALTDSLGTWVDQRNGTSGPPLSLVDWLIKNLDAAFAPAASGCGEASCVPSQGAYVSHFTGAGCTGTESYYLPYDGYAYACRSWDGGGQCGTLHRTVTNVSYRYNGVCYDAWPSGNTLSDFVTVYRGGSSTPSSQTLTVSRLGTGSGTVTSSPAGISCGSVCSASFASSATVTLTASPASGSTFAGWSGACSGTGSCSVAMSAARSVSATFNAAVASGCGEGSCVSAQGAYISHFTGAGCTGTESYYLPYDGYAYACRSWDGGGQCGTLHRTVTNVSYRYNGVCYDAWPSGNTLSDFVTVYRGGSSTPASQTLTVSRLGTGSGTVTSSPAGISCGGACSASFANSTTVTLTASPASGSTFAGWSGACSGTGSCTVTMSAARSVSTTFNAAVASGCGEASCVSSQGMYVSHYSGPGCTGTESYYLPYDGYGYACRSWNGSGQCGTLHRTVTNYSARINGGPCQDLWPSGNTLSDFVTIYR